MLSPAAGAKGNYMLSRSTRALLASATALGAGVFVALPSALMATTASASSTGTGHIKPGHIIWNPHVHSDITRAGAARAAASLGFTNYTASVKVGTKTYTYTIAGKNPAVKTANPAASINVELVPLIMKFANGMTWDPTKADSCDAGASALSRTQNSPIFKAQNWTWGGTAIGNGQVTDAYQRADFWKFSQPGGINPKFAVNLVMKTTKAVTITVPKAQSGTGQIKCGNKRLGAANINWLDPFLQRTVIPSLKSQGVSTKTLPIFLLHNFVEFAGSPGTCCILGYHNAYSVSGGTQTYGLAMFDDSGFFGSGSSDISALSHEVAEWQNDPTTVNPTPKWGNIGQVQGCQGNLEVGDPLSGTIFADTVGGFTYHPQELAFFSWFYHQNPSLGVHGWYSDQGTFKKAAAACS